MLTDVLAHLRDLMTQSGMTIQHSSCPNTRDMVMKTSARTEKHQFEIFQYMNEHGYYPIKNVDDKELKSAIDMHCGKGVKLN